ncbi:MAG: helix-turn-helix domain-containing protein [Propionibacteriaceae bacterium]|jgi:transcriptional regulator with XRE-family HTH domain|nr:helix-turn-helix domain-containing protein [Propionibacteriaceae bacterium]
MTSPPAYRVRKYIHTLQRFGVVVREERLGLNLTQQQLAKKAGVSLSYLKQVENGRAKPNVAAAHVVLASLGIKPLVLPAALFKGPRASA